MEPLNQPIAIGSGARPLPTETGLIDLFSPEPARRPGSPTPPPGTETIKDAGRVAFITLGLSRVRVLIPGRPGEVFGTLISGTGRNPATGAPTFSAGTGLNFAPAPIGYAHPQTFGLEPNFYLPGGSTMFIPRALDPLGFGLAQQRSIDEAEAAATRARAAAFNPDAAPGRRVLTVPSPGEAFGFAPAAPAPQQGVNVFIGDIVSAAAAEIERRRQRSSAVEVAALARVYNANESDAERQVGAIDDVLAALPPDP